MFTKIDLIIGNANKAADRIMSIAYEFGVIPGFTNEVLENADRVAKPFDLNDKKMQQRLKNSIKNLDIVTIDGADSKDLDDAIYVETLPNGNYKLLVAIADVSHYVTPRSPLDYSALKKGNSTYLVNRVIPMLPEILSNGVCSLNPDEEKLCMVCEIEFNLKGEVINKKVYESIMISKARLTYDEVNDFFKTNNSTRSKEIQNMLLKAKELFQILQKARTEKGSIEFDIFEPKIILDNDFNVIDIKSRIMGESEKLIENFMVSANEAVATLINDLNLPFVYRNHQNPKEENLVEWYSLLTGLGIDPKLNNIDKINPKNINKTLARIEEQITNRTEREVINITLLKFMEKAQYELDNIGHFGLASECYTHFTSPIRRYSDLMVHRYLKQYLIEKDLNSIKLESNTKFIEKASLIINDTEKNSVSAEREVNKVCMAEYMTKFIGQEFEGVIAAVLKFGLFIQLPNSVEGLVHVSELTDFKFDSKMNIFVNSQNNVYKLGQIVKIKVKDANVKKRIIDFVLV